MGQVVFAQENEGVVGDGDVGHKGVEKVHVGAAQAGSEDTVEDKKDGHLDGEVDGFGDDDAAVFFESFADFFFLENGIVTVFVPSAVDVFFDVAALFLGPGGRDGQGEHENADGDGEENNGHTHVGVLAGDTGEAVVVGDQEVKKRLVDEGGDEAHEIMANG